MASSLSGLALPVESSVCPVCASTQVQLFFSLPHFPVYLHALSGEVSQVSRDLHYAHCVICGHTFIPGYERTLLEDIYRHHYWGADVASVGYSQREEFVTVFRQVRESLQESTLEVLEVGCSSGQMLSDLHTLFPADHFSGFEPNVANAQACAARGFAVENGFFGIESAQESLSARNGRGFSLIYHRHVIEHVFDFADFLGGMTRIAAGGAVLLIETPSLEENLRRASLDPFHHEHIHVFSLSSLVRLAAEQGWLYQSSVFTAMGNMIVVFVLAADAVTRPALPLLALPDTQGFARQIAAWQQRLQAALAGRKVVFWGAGSYCTVLLSLCGISPQAIVDGNPHKTGQHMAGSTLPIQHAMTAVAAWVAAGEDTSLLLVVASSFYREIQASLQELGWRGEVIVPSLWLGGA